MPTKFFHDRDLSLKIGKNVRFLRKIKRIRQIDLVILTDSSIGTIRRLEAGLGCPAMETAIKLADCFDVSLDELVGREKKRR